jgi:hypothetical protein
VTLRYPCIACAAAALVLVQSSRSASDSGPNRVVDGRAQAAASRAEGDPAGKTRDDGRVARLADAARRLGSAVVLVGHPDGWRGTAFVISRKHRLLATTAHVADYDLASGGLLAVPNGTADAVRVERIWYHPGIIRRLDEGLYARSDDPRDGELTLLCPDVAVLQLSEGGPELPAECDLAPDEGPRALDSQPVGLLGFPGDEGPFWPTESHKAAAKFTGGVMTRVAGLPWDRGAPPGQGDWITSSAKLGNGSSGGPLFLADGRVVGLYSRPASEHPGSDTCSVKSRCVKEIILYYRLGDRVDGAPGRPEWGPDPNLPRLRRAVELVREADALRRRGDYRAAGARCNEAIRSVPGYAWAYLQRSKVYLGYSATSWGALSFEERARYTRWAFDDSLLCIEILAKSPEWMGPSRADTPAPSNDPYLIHAENMKNTSMLNDYSPRGLRMTVGYIDAMILPRKGLDDADRAFALNCRAQCRRFLGEWDGARRDFDEAIRLAPDEPRWRINRALLWERLGRPDLAAEDRRAAERLRREASAAPDADSSP